MKTNIKDITISIIIPCKNEMKFLKRCLDSIVDQSEPADEIILIDDASTDGSGDFAKTFANVKVFNSTSNLGPGGARNLGVDKATKDYIMFVDADDYLFDNKAILNIKKSLATANSPDCALLSFQVLRKNTGNNIFLAKLPNGVEDLGGAPVSPCLKVFKRDLYVKMPPYTLSEDTAWSFLQLDQFNSAIAISDTIYVYDRTNNESITDTVEWCGIHSITLEQCAFEDILIKAEKNDKWIPDVIRNLANMYEIRNSFTHPAIKKFWSIRFKQEYQNFMTGHFIH